MYAVEELLARYRARSAPFSAGSLRIQLEDGRLVTSPWDEVDPETGQTITQTMYNCSAPFVDPCTGQSTLWVRCEPLHTECGYIARTVRNGDFWELDGTKVGCAQDPSIMVAGGVPLITYNKYVPSNGVIDQVEQHVCPLGRPDEPIAVGPLRQKCCRVKDLPNGKIAVIGRKQEWPTLRGQYTYIEIDELSELQEAIPAAQPIEEVFDNTCWVGANQLIDLGTNPYQFGILGHVARFNPERLAQGSEVKQYYPTISIFDQRSRSVVAMEIIADAADEHFPLPATTKMAQLQNVIYPGGLVTGESRLATYRLYGGVGDLFTVWMDLDIPLLEEYSH